MSVTPSRRIAFEILLRVETRGGYAADLLHARLDELGEVAKGKARGAARERDRALATELTLGVLRWQRLLDFLLEHELGRPASSLDAEVRLALRLGLYQLQFLTRVPARAAVNESVELVKHARKRSAAGLVNVVLRRAATDSPRRRAGQAGEAPVAPHGEFEKLLSSELPRAERLGILWSHPTWLVERWLARFGERRTIALLEANNQAPRLTCALLPGRTAIARGEVIASLEEVGLRVQPGRWLRSAVEIAGGNPARTEAYRQGWISIQDEASQMIPLLFGSEPRRSVLDLCAAPGGKTAQLTRLGGPAARMVAADLHPQRLRAMRRQLERVGIQDVRSIALDATRPLPFATRFDAVLVDAPCSGTGTLARNPEIRWRLRPEDLEDFHRRQVQLVQQAVESLAHGGQLVYSTCSLEPEENERVVEEVLGSRSDLCAVAAAEHVAPHLREGVTPQSLFDAEGFLRTFPPEHGADGFFAATLERR